MVQDGDRKIKQRSCERNAMLLTNTALSMKHNAKINVTCIYCPQYFRFHAAWQNMLKWEKKIFAESQAQKSNSHIIYILATANAINKGSRIFLLKVIIKNISLDYAVMSCWVRSVQTSYQPLFKYLHTFFSCQEEHFSQSVSKFNRRAAKGK